MPTLDECMQSIRELVEKKGHGDSIEDFPKKLLFAFIEVGEASDLWKKYGLDPIEVVDLRFTNRDVYHPTIHILEEIIDAIFYLLDAYGLIYRKYKEKSPDEMFKYKLRKNLDREYRYGRPESRIGRIDAVSKSDKGS